MLVAWKLIPQEPIEKILCLKILSTRTRSKRNSTSYEDSNDRLSSKRRKIAEYADKEKLSPLKDPRYFPQQLVLYWLSKHGFECARVDHTGIDLIARNPHSDEVMGISVKSRSRNPGTENVSI